MPKNAYYFQHDYNARNDDKILEIRSKYKSTGYAIYFYCLETMAERGDGYIIPSLMGGLSLGFGVAKDWLLEFLEFCVKIKIFEKNDVGYFSPRIIEHLEIRAKFSKAGSKGAEKRWPGYSPPNSPPYTKERKGKEKKYIIASDDAKNPNQLKDILKWQELSLTIIKEIQDAKNKKSSVFKCCKDNPAQANAAFQDCKELGKLNILYFFKVYNELIKNK